MMDWFNKELRKQPNSSEKININIIPCLSLEYFVESNYSQLTDTPVISLDESQGKDQQVVKLVDIKWLKTHEEVLYDRVNSLKDAIRKWNAYRLPLLVDGRSGAILDGHHRYHVGRQLGLTRLPAVLVDYLKDESIDVDVWPECGIDCLSKEDVIKMSLSDNVFPPKTSKHSFVEQMKPINIPLSDLT